MALTPSIACSHGVLVEACALNHNSEFNQDSRIGLFNRTRIIFRSRTYGYLDVYFADYFYTQLSVWVRSLQRTISRGQGTSTSDGAVSFVLKRSIEEVRSE